jgi:hypothetical protein
MCAGERATGERATGGRVKAATATATAICDEEAFRHNLEIY